MSARVTLGVPVYNGEAYLAQALSSLAAQDYDDVVILVSDNASTDATADIVRDFMSRDERLRYVRQDHNVGGARNSNSLLAAATTPYFKWAHYDDLCDPSLVRRCVEVLEDGGPRVLLAYPQVRHIDASGNTCGTRHDDDLDIASGGPQDRLRELLRRVVTQVQFGVVRTEVAQSVGGVSVSTGGEMVFPVAMALRGRLELVPGRLLGIRQHEARHGGDRTSETAWVDPSRPHVPYPYARSWPLLLREVGRAPLSAAERARCVQVLVWHWFRPGWKTVVGDTVRLPRDLGWVKPGRTP